MGLCGDEKALGSLACPLTLPIIPSGLTDAPQSHGGGLLEESVKGADWDGGAERSPDPTQQEAPGVARCLPPVGAVITKRHRRDGTDATEMCFSHVGACKSKVKVLAWLGEGPLQVADFLCPRMAEGTRELAGDSLIRALIPLTRAPPSHDLDHLAEACVQTPPHCAAEFQRVDSGGTRTPTS